MKLKSDHLVGLGLLIALNTMAAAYLGNFQQGAIEGGSGWRFVLKFLSVGCLILVIFRSKLLSNQVILALTGIHCLMATSTLALIALTDQFPRDTQWLNFHLSLVALWVSYDWCRRRGSKGGAIAVPLSLTIVVSLIIDSYVFQNGTSLWENKAFIGTLGNPSTFGFICVVGILYTRHLSSFSKLLLGGVLCAAAIATQSLFAIISAAFVFFYINRKVGLLLLPVGMLFSVQIYFVIAEMHFLYKLASLGQLFGVGVGDSASVGTRVDFYTYLLRLVSEYPYALLIGHPGGIPYLSGDAGWFSLFVSYGIPLTAAYILVVTSVIITRRANDDIQHQIAQGVCILFLCFMLVNRIHDYWPIAIVFYWHIGEILASKAKNQ